MRLALVTITVRDYDEAIVFYTQKLGFRLVEDRDLGGGKRWVRVTPPASGEAGSPALLLARAVTPQQITSVGNQAGGRVLFFLETDNFARDYAALVARGVVCVRAASEESYGSVAVFRDLYGNTFDLIQPRGTK